MIPFTIFVSLLLILAETSSPEFKDCNFTDLRFQSKYNLGKQDQLNNTFDAINPQVKIPDVIYPVNSYTNYSLTAITTSLQYLDARQKAEIMGNDTILIDGGFLQATLQMKWARKDFMQRGGSIQALCRSQQIMFTKNMTIQRGFLVYEVSGYYNVTFDSECKITRYEPANMSETDLGYIRQLLNQRDDSKDTAKSQLQTEVNKRYFTELNNSLYNQKHQLDNKFIYNWADSKRNKSIQLQYQVLPTGVDIEKDGLSFTYVTQIKDYEKWQCGASIPHQNLDVTKYGGIQEFISLSVFKNTLKFGIEAGVLDTVLNKQNWSSRMFQFYAGDLYQVMPYVSETYRASEPITGSCQGLADNILITPEQKINDLLVVTGHSCSLFINGTTKVLDIKITLYTQIEARFEEESKVNFYVKGFTHNLSYLQQSLFKIDNYPLANEMVLSTLNGILNAKTFLSGWPTFSMDLPQIKVMQAGYVVLYDTSHIGDIYQTDL